MIGSSRIRRFRPRPLATGLLAVLALLSACSSESDAPPDPPLPLSLPATGDTGAILPFDGDDACDALASHLTTWAQALVRTRVESQRWAGSGPIGFAGVGHSSDATYGRASAAIENGVATPVPVLVDGQRILLARSAGGVVGLDRIDLDGSGAMAIAASRRWPAAGTGEWARGVLDGGGSLLLETETVTPAEPVYGVLGTTEVVAQTCTPSMCLPILASPPRLRLRWIDPRTFTPLRELTIPGRIVQSHRRGDRLVVVTAQPLTIPVPIETSMPWGRYEQLSRDDWYAEMARRLDGNEARIAALTLADWLAPLGSSEPITAAYCGRFARIDRAVAPGFTQITTIDLTTGDASQRTLLAGVSGLHLSADEMVLTSRPWDQGPARTTDLHRFVPAPGTDVYVYRGSLAVPGEAGVEWMARGPQGALLVSSLGRDANGTPTSVTTALLDPSSSAGRWTPRGRLPVAMPASGGLVSLQVFGSTAWLRTTDPRSAGDRFQRIDFADPDQPRTLSPREFPGRTAVMPAGSAAAPNRLIALGTASPATLGGFVMALFDDGARAEGPPSSQLVVIDPSEFAGTSGETPILQADQRSGAPAPAWVVGVPYLAYAQGLSRPTAMGLRIVTVRPDDPQAPLAVQGTLDLSDRMLAELSRSAGSHPPWRALFIGEHVYGLNGAMIRSAPIDRPDAPSATLLLPFP